MNISYFGFGSLVNHLTRPNHPVAQCARLAGWSRIWNHHARAGKWRQPNHRELGIDGWTVLSVRPDPGKTLEGMLVTVDSDELEALDQREAGYNRVELDPADIQLVTPGAKPEQPIYMYVSKPEQHGDGDEKFPLLQSYVDCVMAGYRREFGESGLKRFVDSTAGWNAPMLLDRVAPGYVRAVDLDHSEAEKFDELLRPLLEKEIHSTST